MRKLIFFLAALALTQLYNYWTLEVPPAPARAPVAVAPPVERPRVYYHSPLDAPAMSATAYTSMGYFSTDSSSQFDRTRATIAPVRTAALVSDNGLVWGEEGERAEIQRLQSVYKLPRTSVAGTLGGRVPSSAYATD